MESPEFSRLQQRFTPRENKNMAAITTSSSELAVGQSARKGRRPHRSPLETSARQPRRRRQRRSRSSSTVANDQHGHSSERAAESSDDNWSGGQQHSIFDQSEREPRRTGTTKGVRADKSDAEKTSFLSMYFRDMSSLEVLRPEEEFVTARRIEELELTVWQEIFCYPPLVQHLIQLLEQTLDQPVAEFSALMDAVAQVRKSNTKSARNELHDAARTCAGRLHTLDSDRDYLIAVLREIDRVQNGCPTDLPGKKPRFSTKSRRFVEYAHQVRMAEKAAERVRNEFVRANLRLVVSIARRFNHGRMALADLIQEGNIGLMKAVQRYDYRRGFRFSTYASWWIRHAISRALADKGREVRLPVHMIDAHHKLSKAKRELTSKLGRKPTNIELSEASQIPIEKIEKMRGYLIDQSFSLDRPVNDEDGRSFLEFLRDPHFEDDSMTDTLNQHALACAVRNALMELKPIEADILRQRFGLDTGNEHTLKQIGQKYNLSRERIRQLQEQALSKVRVLMERRRLAM